MSHVKLIVYGFLHNFEKINKDIFIPFGIKFICCQFYGYPDFFVVTRFRPTSDTEKREQKMQDLPNDEPEFDTIQQITMKRPVSNNLKQRPPFKVVLDHIFNPLTPQKTIFNLIGRQMIHNILKGSGSGKSYTMFGPEKPKTESDLGLVQRCCNYLFHKLNQSDEITKWTFQISFLQIYKEHLTDLLESPSTTKELQIRTDVHTNISHIHNLKYVTIHNIVEFLMHLNIALSHRIIRSHKISCSSSRSHLLLMINIKQTLGNNKVKISKLTFVDMCGSEDIRKALGSNPDPERMREAKCINLSVSALTTVINDLSRNRIPLYISSVLTHILQHALGGNCKTTLIITASPHQFNRSETIRSMRFGMTAKTIKNNAKINYKNIDSVMNDNMVDKTVIDLEQVLDDIEPVSYISSLCSDDNESKSNDSNYNINEHKVEYIYIDLNKKIIYEGYMCKEGKIFKTWRKRYFILNDNGIMAYYYKKGDENSINSFNVKTMNKIKTKIFGKTKQFGIELSTNKRVWKFLCINEKDMKHWIKALSHFK